MRAEVPRQDVRIGGVAAARPEARHNGDGFAGEVRLGLRGGVLVANPIPEADAIPAAEIDARIDEAVADAARAGVTRKDVTPYLLARITELTAGRSLTANIALVRNNAAFAARTAVALAALG